MFYCTFCNKESESKKSSASHQVRCSENPNKIARSLPDNVGKPAWNTGLTSTDPRVAKRAKTWSDNYAAGLIAPGGCIKPEWHASDAGKAAKSKGGGYRENAGRSKKFKVFDSFGKETTLQSSYELECSEILNLLGIKWNRPKALKYDGRNYFADFYLPELDVWLDPKNDYKSKLDAEKIKKVIEQNNVKLFVLSKEQLTKEYIARLAEKD